ncbi:MAG: ChaN family lipoprotein, partial [Deltaproteobacteria bacterium]|nr:ChaN family lipoprotein [Deltaproteobacteria bacterium]
PRGPRATPIPAGGIAAAGLPYQILDARTGRQVDTAVFWAKLAASNAVCVGEEHPNPHHHWVQLEVVNHVAKTTPLALGMEMFQRPFQGVLDDYAAKRIDAAALRSRSGWEERWVYDYGLYGPTIDVVVAAHGQLLALNAARELTKKVVRKGLDALTADERAQVPELDLTDKNHRAWFDTLMESMGGHGGHSTKKMPAPEPDKPPEPAPAAEESPHGAAPPMPSADQIYTVQVIWDETMADTSAKWLKANPAGHLVILAGNGHCHDTAIINRIKRRGVTNVISIRPVIDEDGQVAELLARPMNDYLVVLQVPPGTKPAPAE